MGIRIGYSYNCGKCGKQLDNNEFFLINALNPIQFDYLVKHCDYCGNLYSTHKNEFFTVNKKSFSMSLVFSMIGWYVLLLLIICCVFEEVRNCYYYIFTIVFIPIYYFIFKWRWQNGIKDSLKRIDDAHYIYDLLQFNILKFDAINMFYKHKIISYNTYNDILFMMKDNNAIDTNSLIDRLKENSKIIKCKVCDKEIPYNENGTCKACHEEIMRRLEAKNKK